MNELLREAIRFYMEERQERLRSPQDYNTGRGRMRDRPDIMPAALYLRVFSDR